MTFSQANAQTQWYQDTEMLNDEELFASPEDWETDDVDIMEDVVQGSCSPDA